MYVYLLFIRFWVIIRAEQRMGEMVGFYSPSRYVLRGDLGKSVSGRLAVVVGECLVVMVVIVVVGMDSHCVWMAIVVAKLLL